MNIPALICILSIGQVQVSTDYEGGSLGRVEHISPEHLRCTLAGQADHEGRNRQASWYDFRLDNLPTDQRPVRIDLVDLVGEYNYRAGTHAVTRQTRPVISVDRKNWRHLRDEEVSWDDPRKELTLRFTPDAKTLWIAHIPPYTTEDLRRLEAEVQDHRTLERTSVGQTPEGRSIPLWTITDPDTPSSEKKVVWCMARQHAWEAGSSWVAEGLVRFLLSNSPEAADIRRRVVFRVFPMTDPDGVASGRVRFNADGHDLNRNWDAVDPRAMPEIAAQRAAIVSWLGAGRPIDLFLTIHNTEAVDYLEGPITEGGDAVRRLADRLHETLSKSPTFDSPGGPRDLRPPAGEERRGRRTVHEALSRDHGLPAFLMELRVEECPKLGRCATIQDRLDFGADLAKALAAAVSAQ